MAHRPLFAANTVISFSATGSSRLGVGARLSRLLPTDTVVSGDDHATDLALLADQIRACHACAGMNIIGETQAAPGFGAVDSPIMLVGQSLCGPCMASQIPFTGGSGRLIDRSLKLAGIAKHHIFITNVVHCHPPRNRPSYEHEIANCVPFLRREIQIVQPLLVVGLGRDACSVLKSILPTADIVPWPFEIEPAAASQHLLFAPHPSWVMRQPREVREAFVASLARAIAWSFMQ